MMKSKFTAAILSVASLFFSVSIAHAQSNAIPFLNQPLVPSAVTPGGPAFTLTVNGTGFVSGATVNWNGNPRATTLISSSQLTAQIAAGDIVSPQTASVTVTNPGSQPSNPSFLQVTFPATLSNFFLSNIPVGDTPISIVSGEFSGDGKLDLALVNYASTFISVFLGNGDGTFEAAATIPVGVESNFLTAADFNGDGHTDLAVANYKASTVSIFLGNGDGTFGAPITFLYQGGPEGLAAADLNGDGKLDLIIPNDPGDSVSVLLGNGDGTFQAPISRAIGGPPFGIVVGDFNGDNQLDVALALNGHGVAILLGNGDGTLQRPVYYPSVRFAQALTLADVNGDGKLDLIATIVGSQTPMVDVLLGNGDGTFQPAVPHFTGEGPIGPVVPGDFNGDSKIDLAVNTGASGKSGLALLLGNGDGTFSAPQFFPSVPVGYMASGDFNGDGLLDLGLGNLNGNALSVALQSTLVVSRSTISFAGQGVFTTSQPRSLTLTNIGATAIPINSITFSGADPGDFAQTNTCGGSIAGGATCTVSVTFTPKNQLSRTATMSIADGAVGSPQLVSLSGIGVFASYTLTPATLHFGNQTVGTTSQPQATTLAVHVVELAITSISMAGVNASDFAQTNNCPPVVQPGSFCTINVTFTPSAAGTRSAAVSIRGGFEGGKVVVQVNGTGTN